MNSELYRSVVALIQNNIKSGAIDRARVRQIILGISRDGQSIKLWQQEEWDDYNEYEEDAAIGEISNLDWLEQVDRISFGKQPDDLVDADAFAAIEPSPYLPRQEFFIEQPQIREQYLRLLSFRIREIVAVLKRVAREQALGEFDRLVGLMGLRVSNSNYADLVAIYHPQGAELLPCSERRLPGYSSIYGAAACTPEGLLHFYPETEGEDDDFDEDDADENDVDENDGAAGSGTGVAEPRWFNHYRFADMDLIQIDDGEVVFRLMSSGQSIEMGGGHTHEEWGGPDRTAVEKALVAHFQKHAAHLFFQLEAMPDPADADAFTRWLALYEKQDKKAPLRVLREALDRNNLEGARRFLEMQTLTGKEQQSVHERYVEHALKHEDYREVIRLVQEQGNPERERSIGVLAPYYRALLMKGEAQKVYEFALEGLADPDIDADRYRVQACYRFIAAKILEQEPGPDVSLERVGENSAKNELYRLARSLELYAEDREQSLEWLLRLLQGGDYPRGFAEVDLKDAPELLALARWYHDCLDDSLQLDPAALEKITPGETKRLQSVDALRAKWRAGEELERFAVSEDFEELDETRQASALLFQDGERRWVRLPETGFAELRVDAAGKIELAHRTGEQYVDALTAAGELIYACCRGELCAYRSDPGTDDAAPELIARKSRFVSERGESISVADGLLALSSGREIELYDVRDAQSPELLKLIRLPRQVNGEYTSCSQLLLAGGRLYLMLYDVGCYAFDVREPRKPALLGAAELSFTPTGCLESEGRLALYGSSHLQFVDFRNPQAPRGLQILEGAEDRYDWVAPLPIKGDAVFRLLYADKDGHVHHLQYDSNGEVVIEASHSLVDREELRFTRVHDPMAVVEVEAGYLAITSDETHLLEREALPVYEGLSIEQQAVGAKKLDEWLSARFAEFHQTHEGQAAGLVVCEGNGRELELFLDCQRSLPGLSPAPLQLLEPGAFPFVKYSVDWLELMGIPAPEGEEQYDRLNEEKRTADVLVQKTMSVAALRGLVQSPEFQRAVAAKAYLISGFEYTCEIFECLSGDGEWRPQRREFKAVAALPLQQILTDSGRWDSTAAKAGDDEGLKAELHELGRAGDYGALQVIRRRLWVAEDESIEVILHAVREHAQYFWLHFIEDFTGRDDVQAVYLEVYDTLIKNLEQSTEAPARHRPTGAEGTWSGALVDVAIGLGYQDRPELDPLFDRLLFEKERVDYNDYDIATKLLAAKENIAPYAETIRRALKNMEPRENRMPALAEQGFRAGVYEIPEGLLEQSRPEKSGEQYTDQKIGIKSLDQLGDHQYDVCRVERLFTAKIVLDRFRECNRNRYNETPLWPSELQPEPYPGSWKFFLAGFLQQLDRERELDDLIEHVCLRLKAGEEYAADREIFKALFKMLIEDRDRGRFGKMIEAVRANVDAMGEQESAKLNKLREGAEINIAWQAN